MADFSTELRRVLANRHSPEATALFHELLAHIHRRVAWRARDHYTGLLTSSEVEEIIGDVLYDLMEGALSNFRGHSMGELVAFAQTISDRKTMRAARRRIREREFVDRVRREVHPPWQRELSPPPDRMVEWLATSPLTETDQDYLRQLLRCGSKAALARAHGVSRAAVTQRIQRIRQRLEGLCDQERASHEAWLQQEARGALQDGSSQARPTAADLGP